jgi:trimeric autotransporter adhesin
MVIVAGAALASTVALPMVADSSVADGASDPGTIDTIAGGSVPEPVPATSMGLAPNAVLADGHSFFVTDSTLSEVREVDSSGNEELIAGNGTNAFVGDGGPATSAAVSPAGMALDKYGNLLIVDGNRIRVVAKSTGTFYDQAMTQGDIYTIAGNGTFGFSGDDGPATAAELDQPADVAVDAFGNLAISDEFNSRIRVVAESTGTFYGVPMTMGDIYTVAGNGTYGFSGDGGPATGAAFYFPIGVAVDGSGNLLIADSANNRIRVVAASTGTFYGIAMTIGDVYTVAGTGTGGFSGDGGPPTSAELADPTWLSVDPEGDVFISDTDNQRIRMVAASNGPLYGVPMNQGDIYTVAGDGTRGYGGDGGYGIYAELDFPGGISVDSSRNLIIADPYNGAVRVVAPFAGTFYGQDMTGGYIYTVAGYTAAGVGDSCYFSGVGVPATSGQLCESALAVDQSQNTLLCNDQQIQVVAASTGTFYGQAMTQGDIYTVAGDGTAGYSGDGGPARSAELNYPRGLAIDAAGNIVINDSANWRIRVVAASTGTFYGQAMTQGDIYTVAGDGSPGFGGDGGPAISAELNLPSGVAVDDSGNLLIADDGNDRVRVVAASTGTFYGQAMTEGDIYTVAGNGSFGYSGDTGPATSAELNNPQTVVGDPFGNLVIADMLNNRIRVVAGSTGNFYGQSMIEGDIYTIAGNGTAGFGGDGGNATSAEVNNPHGLAVDSSGNLIVADSYNDRIRAIAASTGTFYGQSMIEGDIYTIAGSGTAGYAGDGGVPTAAELYDPYGVAVASSGNVLIADAPRVRVLTAWPFVHVSPSSGRHNTSISATAGGFTPGERVKVTYLTGLKAPSPRSVLLCGAVAASDGTINCTGAIPARSSAGAKGPHSVEAKGVMSKFKAFTIFVLT